LDKIEENNVAEFLKYYENNKKYHQAIIKYLQERCVKVIDEKNKYKVFGFNEMEKKFYNYQLNKHCENTSSKYNTFLSMITSTETAYNGAVNINFANPLNHWETRHIFVKMTEGYLDPQYKFNLDDINQMLLFLDKIELINNNKNQKELMQFLVNNKKSLGSNYSNFVNDNYGRISSISLYNNLLRNTKEHELAYSELKLNGDYKREENAIGYTPDDIIMYRTIKDHYECAIPNKERSNAIKNIDRTKQIIKFNETEVEMNKLAENLLPEMFNFTQFTTKNDFVILLNDEKTKRMMETKNDQKK
jgi:hypothetical protein